MVDIVAKPAIIAIATTYSRKTMPAHDHDNNSRAIFFWRQPNDVDVDAPATAKPGQKDGVTGGGGEGTEDKSMLLSLSAADQSKLPMAMQNPLPTTTTSYHWTHFVLLPLFHLQSRGGLEKQPLLVVLSSYVHCYVSVLHLILIDFVLES